MKALPKNKSSNKKKKIQGLDTGLVRSNSRTESDSYLHPSGWTFRGGVGSHKQFFRCLVPFKPPAYLAFRLSPFLNLGRLQSNGVAVELQSKGVREMR